MVESYMLDLGLGMGGIVLCVISLMTTKKGWEHRTMYNLVADEPVIAVRDIKREGSVELEGTISSSDGDGFVSPIGQREETVLAAWKVERWDEIGENSPSQWRTVATGIDAEPFYLTDDTDRVRVEIDADDDVNWQFDVEPVVVDIGVKEELPANIESFVDDHGLTERSNLGSDIANIANIGRSHGDRRYTEWTFGADNDIYLNGQIHATERATEPLHPEDAIVSPVDREEFFISDRSAAEMADQSGSKYRLWFALSVLLLIVGAVMIYLGMSL